MKELISRGKLKNQFKLNLPHFLFPFSFLRYWNFSCLVCLCCLTRLINQFKCIYINIFIKINTSRVP